VKERERDDLMCYQFSGSYAFQNIYNNVIHYYYSKLEMKNVT